MLKSKLFSKCEVTFTSMIEHECTSVRRIFERVGPGNLRKLKTKRKVSLLRFSPIFGPKLDEDRKKRSSLRFNPIFGPKFGEDQKKNKSSVRFCPFVRSNFVPNLQRGACRTFAYLSMLIILFWRPKGGAWHHAPPKYAPA